MDTSSTPTSNWANKYIGIPYKLKGRDTNGLDCWGLVRLVLQNEFNISLPSFSEEYTSNSPQNVSEILNKHREGWALSTVPKIGDVVLFKTNGLDSHIGILVRPGFFLHIIEGNTSIIERLGAPKWKNILVGTYKYTGNTADISTISIPHPLKTFSIATKVSPGESLLTILNNIRSIANVPESLEISGTVVINDIIVPQEQWETYIPSPGDRIEFRAVPTNKNTFRKILTLGVIIIAAVAAPSLVGLMGGSAATATAAAVGVGGLSYGASLAIATMGINMVGGLLINAIFPIRPADFMSPMTNSAAGIPLYALQSTNNASNKYGAIPVVLGKFRYSPNSAVMPYTENTNGDSYLHNILIWGYGPLAISDLSIGNTSIYSYEQAQHITFNGASNSELNDSQFNSIYGKTVDTVGVAVELVKDEAWIERTTTVDSNHIVLNFNFPNGLYRILYHNGVVAWYMVKIETEIRLVGSDNWDSSFSVQSFSQVISPAYYNIDSDSYLEPVYKWVRITLSNSRGYVIRKGDFFDIAPTSLSNPISGPGAISSNMNSYILGSNSFIRENKIYPDIGDFEAGYYDLLIYGDTIVYAKSYINYGIYERGSWSVPQGYFVAGGTLSIDGLTLSMTPISVSVGFGSPNILKNQEVVQSTKDGITHSIHYYVAPGVYNIRVRQVSLVLPIEAMDSTVSTLYWQEILCFNDVKPVKPPKPMALTAYRIKANNQLNGMLGIIGTAASISYDCVGGSIRYIKRVNNIVTISVTRNPRLIRDVVPGGSLLSIVWNAMPAAKILVRGALDSSFDGEFLTTGGGYNPTDDDYLIVYNQVGPDSFSTAESLWTSRTTSNPASLFCHVLQHPANAKLVPWSSIDHGTLYKWHMYCEENNFMYNNILTGQRAIFEVLKDIAAAGRASPTLVDGKWSVVIDKPRDEITQHFTPHNSWEFHGVKALPVLPHAFRVSFANEAKGFEVDEYIVYNDGYNASNATLFEGIELPGVTNAGTVYKHARFHLAQLKLRVETYTLNVDVEHLVCQKGDLVRVTHDTPMWGIGSGRIKSTISTTTIELDDELPMDAGVVYTIRIRYQNAQDILSSSTCNIVPVASDGYYSILHLARALDAWESLPGNLILFGSLNKESTDLIVTSIEPSNNMTARLTMVDYAPEIYSSDIGIIPAFNSHITKPPTLLIPIITYIPKISSVTSNESVITRISPGKYIFNIRLNYYNDFVISNTKNITSVEGEICIYGGSTPIWKSIGISPITTPSVLFPMVQESQTYNLRIRYVGSTGITGNWSSVYTHTVQGRTLPPRSITDLRYIINTSDIIIDWTDSIEADVYTYEVRLANTNWGINDSNRVYYGGSSSCTFIPPSYTDSYTIYVKALDDYGNWSTIAASITIPYSLPNTPTSCSQETIKVASGLVNVLLNWVIPIKTSFPVAGYELRNTDTNWGTLGHIYRGDSSSYLLANIPATTSSTYYLKSFDNLGNFSTSSLLITHDVTAPVSMSSVSLTVTRNISDLIISFNGTPPTTPSDFDTYEFRIVQNPGAIIDSNIWKDFGVKIKRTTNTVLVLSLNEFNVNTRISTEGVIYGIACRMRDKSGNYSSTSSLGSIIVTSLSP